MSAPLSWVWTLHAVPGPSAARPLACRWDASPALRVELHDSGRVELAEGGRVVVIGAANVAAYEIDLEETKRRGLAATKGGRRP